MPGWRKDKDTLKGRPRSEGTSGSFRSHEDCRFPWERTVNYTAQRHVFLLAWLLRIQDDNTLLFPGVEFSECFVCTHKHKLKIYTHACIAHTHTQLHNKEHLLVLQYSKLSDAELPQARAPTPRERRQSEENGEKDRHLTNLDTLIRIKEGSGPTTQEPSACLFRRVRQK